MMNIMKKLLACAAIGALSVSALPPQSAHSQAMIVEELGKSVIGSALHAIFGKGIESIFGGTESLTQEELSEELTEKFAEYRDESIKESVDALSNQISIYGADMSDESRLRQTQDILEKTSDILSALDHNMSEANFWDFYPDYIYVMNIRLGFLSERYLIEPTDHGKEILAREALNGITNLYKYFADDFTDPANYDVVEKKDDQVVYGPRATPVNTGEGHQDPNKISKHYYETVSIGNGGLDYDPYVPWRGYWEEKHVFRIANTNDFYFVYKRVVGTYHLEGPFPDAETANKARASLSIKNYPERLGNPTDIAVEWWKIVDKMGTDAQQPEADAALANIGVYVTRN